MGDLGGKGSGDRTHGSPGREAQSLPVSGTGFPNNSQAPMVKCRLRVALSGQLRCPSSRGGKVQVANPARLLRLLPENLEQFPCFGLGLLDQPPAPHGLTPALQSPGDRGQ